MTFSQLLASLWRRRITILACIVVGAVAAVGYDQFQTKTYQASAQVAIAGSNQPSGSSSSSAPPVNLPDPIQELQSVAVQKQAAVILGAKGASSVAGAVTGSLSSTTGALTITASDTDPARAEAVANAYAQAFLVGIQDVVQAQENKITASMSALSKQITALQASGATPPTGSGGTGGGTLSSAKLGALLNAYDGLQTQLTSIQIGGPYASITAPAGYPTTPTGLSTKKLAGIGLLAGILVGIGAALVRDQLDTRLRSSADIASVTGTPVLAELPLDTEIIPNSGFVALADAPRSQLAESVRELRTSLRVLLEDSKCPMVVVTSPAPNDGKTFVTANLGAALALTGSQVVVVSADFRRSAIEQAFEFPANPPPLGLADIVNSAWLEAGEAGPDLDDNRRLRLPSLLLHTRIDGLWVLPAGRRRGNASELFASPGLQSVIRELPEFADFVLWDMPPVLALPDATTLARFADGVVVVAAEGRTDQRSLASTLQRLEETRARVLGIVLNRVRHPSTATYHPYYYSADPNPAV